jgi:multiple sugar transport system permease protein
MKRFRNKYWAERMTKLVIGNILRYLLLIGLSFIILYPLILKLSTSFMTEEDLLDTLVVYIPRNFTLDNYKVVAKYTNYFTALKNTFFISFFCGIVQMFICSYIGYGLARFKFKGRGLVTMLMYFTILAPPSTFQTAMYLKFRYFDFFGIIKLFTGNTISLLDTFWPLAILSFTGFAFKNGLFIFMMRQYFKNIPEELEEAAYVDGSGVFRTYFKIILPLAKSMLLTVFLFSFAWQWTDTFYTRMFFSRIKTLSNALLKGFEGMMVAGKTLGLKNGQPLTIAYTGTMSLMVIAPLIIIYIFAQKSMTEGIERSGIVG